MCEKNLSNPISGWLILQTRHLSGKRKHWYTRLELGANCRIAVFSFWFRPHSFAKSQFTLLVFVSILSFLLGWVATNKPKPPIIVKPHGIKQESQGSLTLREERIYCSYNESFNLFQHVSNVFNSSPFPKTRLIHQLPQLIYINHRTFLKFQVLI